MTQPSASDLQAQVDALKSQLQQHVGVDFSATSQGSPHPGQLIMYQHVHGPYRQSVDATHTGTFYMEFDSDVRALYKSKLTFRLAKVRSNAAGSTTATAGSSAPTTSSGGSQAPTSSSGGSQTPTSSSGGSQTPTSGSGGSQTPTSEGDISGSVTVYPVAAWPAASGSGGTGASGNSNSSTSHGHSENADVSYTQSATTGSNDVDAHTHNGPSHTHTFEPGYSVSMSAFGHTHGVTIAAHTHSVTVAAHDHTVTVAAHDHTVTVAAHDHTVTIAGHTHTMTMTYGIYEGPAPSTPGITLAINGTDVTSALGGPWNAGATVDITTYLREHTLQPLYQANTIVFGSSELLDIEFEARSLCATASPLGLAL